MSDLIIYIEKIERKGISIRGDSIYYENAGEWIEYTKKELELFQPGFEEWLKVEEKNKVFLELQNICNEKNEAVYKLVLGHNSSPGQIERYKNKYERAIDGKFDKKLNAIIIEKYEAARKAVEFFVDMIEAFREGVDDMIKDGELDRAQKAIELAQEFNHKTTMDDIKKILIGA